MLTTHEPSSDQTGSCVVATAYGVATPVTTSGPHWAAVVGRARMMASAALQDTQAEVDTLGKDGDASLAEVAASMGITLEQLLGVPPSSSSAAAAAAAAGTPNSVAAEAGASPPAPRDASDPPPAKRARCSTGSRGGNSAVGMAAAAALPNSSPARAGEGGKRTRSRRSASLDSGPEELLAAVKQEDGVEGGEAPKGFLKREVRDLLEIQEEQAELKREVQRRVCKEDKFKPTNGLVRVSILCARIGSEHLAVSVQLGCSS